jgi:hypothetical protein
MDCDGLRRVLFDHADGLLGRDDADAARDHLAACGPCRALQEEVRRNFTAMDAWDDEDLPAGAFERLQARIPVPAAAAAAGVAPRRPAAGRSWVRLAVPYAAGLATAAAAAWAFLLPASTLPVPRRSGEAPVAAPDAVRLAGPGPGSGSGVVPVSAEGITADARPEPRAPGSHATDLRRGEQRLEFNDSFRGVRRNFRIPGDVDPGKVMLIDRVLPDDEGVK